MLKAINAWTFPGGLDGTLDPREAIRLAAELGFEALELCVGATGALDLDASDAFCDDIRAEAERRGVALASLASGAYWRRALGDADPAAREGARHDLDRLIRIAARLGARTLLVIPGAVDVFFQTDRAPQRYDEVRERAVEGLRAVLPTAERLGVRLGLENVWNRFLLSPTELAEFIDGFGSPALGAYVDVGNVLPFGYPEQWLRILGPRVVGVHFKDFRRAVGTAEGFVDLLEGDVNWAEVVAALGEIGYAGPVAAELIPAYRHHPEVRAANASRAMDAILGRSAR